MDIKEASILGGGIESHWYYRAKLAAVIKLLGSRTQLEVMDIGAGSGFFSRGLIRGQVATRALCVDPNYNVEYDDYEQSRPIFFRRKADSEAVDLLIFMDVLEHVDDDRGLLEHYKNFLKPGGLVMITVPAFEFLWSAHDEFLEHRRRYTLRSVEKLVANVGLELVSGSYLFLAPLPFALLVRFLRRRRRPQSDLRSYPGWFNAVLYGICWGELMFARWNRIGGLSVCCLARLPSTK